MQYLKRQYKETWRFISKDMRWILLGSILVFIAVIVLTHLFITRNPQMQQEIMGEIRNAMPEEIFETETGLPMAAALFKNNIIACLVSVVTGFVPFLFLPAISLCMNAAILGLLGGVYQVNNMSVVGMYVFGILPHGIFEFPALLLSMAMGLRICYCLVKRICEGKYNRGAVKTAVAGSLRTFLLVVIPLLLFAAIIEATLTPFLMGQFMGL